MHFSLAGMRIGELFRFELLAGQQPGPICIPAGVIRVELMLEGFAWLDMKSSSRRVDPGMMILNQEGDQTLYHASDKYGYQCLALNILLNGEERLEGLPRIAYWTDGAEMARAFARRCQEYFANPRFDQGVLVDMILGEVFFQVNAMSYRSSMQAVPNALQVGLEYLERNFRDNPSLEDLARVCGYSRSRIHELFNRHLGVSPFQYLQDLKVRRAKRLLLQTRWSVKWIASDCGFGTAARFSTAFRDVVGSSPREYRKLHQELKGAVAR